MGTHCRPTTLSQGMYGEIVILGFFLLKDGCCHESFLSALTLISCNSRTSLLQFLLP